MFEILAINAVFVIFSPKFSQQVFTGGVSTSTPYGQEFMRVVASDADIGINAHLQYSIVPPINLSLSQGLSHLLNNDNPLFNIDSESGAISLAFDPQPDMKGKTIYTHHSKPDFLLF